MFSTIFKQELKYWLKKPSFYVYSILFFFISTFISAAIAGFFDFLTVSTGSAEIINSPTGIYGVFGAMEYLIFFFLPSIIGISTYRDFKSNIHSILFSYPFSKADYLLAKFFSSTLIVSIIMVVVSIGMFVGFRLPGTNPDIVTSFNLIAYIQAYFVSILPNLLLLGSIVFSIVTFTRNISAGFITVIVFIFLQVALSSILNDPAQDYLLGLLDPFGSESFHYYTKNWTVAERNEFLLPIESLVIINRMLWLAIATIIFILTYRKFSFNQSAYILKLKKVKEERVTKQNFGGTKKITLPKVKYNFTFKQRLIATWRISKMEYKYIVKSWPFISILLLGLIFLFLSTFTMGEIFGTAIRPTTWQMLSVPAGSFFLFINILTFLYSGMLVHRSRMNNVNHLVDATPIPNWSLMASKIIAVIRMQILLLVIIMVSGIAFQMIKGYYNFEIGHYIIELFGLRLLHFMIWAMLAVFIQTLIRNPFLGLFILLLISMALPFLSFAGIEQSIFKYNSTPGFNYSDMNGYGSDLPLYLTHKIYWLCNGIIFLFLSSLFWVRGFTASFKERISVAKNRISKPILVGIIILGLGFISLGYKIYYANNILVERLSSKESEELQVDWEKKYKQYEGKAQPRITDVKTKVDLFPKTKDFKASGTYTMINKTNESISELYLNHNSYPSTFKFSKPNVLTVEDTTQNFDIYTLNTPLLPGEEMTLEFTVKNHENHPLKKRSPVKENGTFINNFALFPSFGYSSQGELTDNKVREKYGLGKNDLKPHPSDTTALGNTYISGDADWINFEATVSTSEDQIAIAPGTKIREWKENGRNYYTYKMDNKILNFYAFNSGRYEIHTDKWKDVDIEIYYHKGHNYNLNYFVDGVKASLDYNSKNFSPYQHKVVRIVEFPRTDGSFAQSFPNTIPYSEGVGFIADIDTTEEGGVDYAFAITVHELAHQWWAHQVIGADVLGSTMMSESLSEYVSLQVLKHHHGESKMRKFLKRSLDEYLVTRSTERKRENALMYNDGQGYIHYQKGSLVFYALSDYIGEDILNNTLKKYVENVKFQEPPYTTSIEMVDALKEVTPDSLQYVIKDMFETITLYQNNIVDVKSTPLDNGKYQVDIEFNVSKYRNNEKGKRYYESDSLVYDTQKTTKPIVSLKLEDYIEVGIFGESDDDNKEEIALYLQKHKFTKINNKISLIVDQEPKSVGIDPYNKLIDANSDDNRRDL